MAMKLCFSVKFHSISKKNAWYNSGTKIICYTYQIPSKCIISEKIEPLKFSTIVVSPYRIYHFLDISTFENQLYWIVRFLYSSDLSCKNSVDFN